MEDDDDDDDDDISYTSNCTKLLDENHVILHLIFYNEFYGHTIS
jgi:hypothetical protein